MKRIAAALALLMLSACSQHTGKPSAPGPEPVVSRYTVTRDVTFTPTAWPQPLLADIYRPAGAGPFPSVLLIHGGAWKRGDRDQVERLATRIAARGYLVMNTTYRLVPSYVFPAQLHDVQQALRWMRSSAGAQQGIDPQRIGAFGYSAGAHLAALVAGVADEPGVGDPLTRVKAVVAGGTPSDLTVFRTGSLVPAFIGGSYDDKADAYRAASPIYHIGPKQPPVFLYHAGFDRLVPVDQATRYQEALQKAGVTNELFIIRGHGHISGFFADGAAVDAALDFLDRYLR